MDGNHCVRARKKDSGIYEDAGHIYCLSGGDKVLTYSGLLALIPMHGVSQVLKCNHDILCLVFCTCRTSSLFSIY